MSNKIEDYDRFLERSREASAIHFERETRELMAMGFVEEDPEIPGRFRLTKKGIEAKIRAIESRLPPIRMPDEPKRETKNSFYLNHGVPLSEKEELSLDIWLGMQWERDSGRNTRFFQSALITMDVYRLFRRGVKISTIAVKKDRSKETVKARICRGKYAVLGDSLSYAYFARRLLNTIW